MIRTLRSIATASLLVTALSSFGCGAPPAHCSDAGSTTPCTCPGGAASTQTCQADGTLGACNCAPTDAGTTDGCVSTFADAGRIDNNGLRALYSEWADANGDGFSDLIVVSQMANFATLPPVINVYLNDHHGGFTRQLPTAFMQSSLPVESNIAGGDFRHDGSVQIAVVTDHNGWMVTLYGSSPDRLSFVPLSTTAGSSEHVYSTSADDLNGDGALDVAVMVYEASQYHPSVRFLLNDGHGNFTLSASSYPVSDTLEVSDCVTTPDLNGDGRADLVCAPLRSSPDSLLFYLQTASGYSAAIPSQGIQGTAMGHDVSWGTEFGDWDGDGHMDVVGYKWFPTSAGHPPDTVEFQRGDGTGRFGSAIDVAVPWDTNVAPGPGRLRAADLNCDGRPDVVGYGTLPGVSSAGALLNNGHGAFSRPIALGGGELLNGNPIGDFNGDHIPDLVLNGSLDPAEVSFMHVMAGSR